MAIGTVKWFNNAKGYGFIRPTEGGEDIFVHFSSIEMEGYKSLKAGQQVTYEVNKGPKGLHALVIKPEDDESTSRTETRVKESAEA
jgi:CspA family cold shock protein